MNLVVNLTTMASTQLNTQLQQTPYIKFQIEIRSGLSGWMDGRMDCIYRKKHVKVRRKFETLV